MNTKKRYISVLMTWDAGDVLSDETILYKVRDYLVETSSLHVQEISIWNDEDEGSLSVQWPINDSKKETPA